MGVRRRFVGIAAVSAACAVLGVGAVPAGAETQVTPPPPLVIRSVDASDPNNVRMVVQVTKEAGDGGNLLVNGSQPAGVGAKTIDSSGEDVGIVYVVDSSGNMGKGDRMKQVIESLTGVNRAKPASQEVALVTFSVTPRLLSGLSTDGAQFERALPSLRVGDRTETSLVDGIATAVDLLEARPELQKNIVLITASGDVASNKTYASIRGDLINQSIMLSVVALPTDGVDLSAGQALAGDTQGLASVVDTGAEIPGAIAAAAQLVSGQRVFEFKAPADATELSIQITGGANVANATVVTGTSVQGRAVQPAGLREPTIDNSLLGGPNGRLIAIALTAVAGVLAAFGVLSIFVRERNDLDSALRAYSESGAKESDGSKADTALVKKASDALAELAERRGALERLEQSLEQADIALRPGEAMFFYLAATLMSAALGFALTGNVIIIVAVIVLSFVMPGQILKMRIKKRRSKFQSQLPEMLQVLSSTLKAGYSLPQGLDAVSNEVPNPAAKELKRVMVEARLGRPLDEAMRDAAVRLDSDDFNWVVMAIEIQREVGGNLAELLLTVADTMTQRERLRRDVKSLTAEGRMSAYVLGVLPPGLGVAIYFMNPEYIRLLWTVRLGQVLLGIATFLMVGGFIWMRKMIEVDV
jgi:tight adherence protein B